MIELGLVITTILLFVLPAAAVGGKRLAARWQAQREAAREQLERERERREAAARAERERIDTLWREHPDIGGLTEYLRYIHLRRGQLDRDRAEAHDDFEQRKQDVDALAADRGGERVPSGHRVLVLVALVLFAVVFCLGIALDYLIFRGLHPGTVLVPLGLACLAVFGIMTGSVIFLGVGRHKLLPASSSLYVRWTVRLFGLMLAGGVALYMTAIAPYRSAAAGQARIDRAVSTLQKREDLRAARSGDRDRAGPAGGGAGAGQPAGGTAGGPAERRDPGLPGDPADRGGRARRRAADLRPGPEAP